MWYFMVSGSDLEWISIIYSQEVICNVEDDAMD